MKKVQGIVASLTVVALVVLASAVPVAAHEGHSEPGQIKPERPSAVQHRDDGTGVQLEDTKPVPPESPLVKDRREEIRAKAAEVLASLKAERTQRSAQEREQRCKAVKQGLETKVRRLVSNAEKHEKRIDDVLAKATAYQESANLADETVTAKLTAAETAKTSATNAVEALKTLQPTIACNKDSVASDVATFREAAAQARTELQGYRQAVKDVLLAIKAVQTTEDSSETE